MQPANKTRKTKDPMSTEKLADECKRPCFSPSHAFLTSSPAISPRTRLPDSLRQYSSKLDDLRGPLRTTSDGNLVDEDTGDWLVLDTPSHDAEDRIQKATKDVPAIDLPEAKNGATGNVHPRKRMSLGQYVSSQWLRGNGRTPVAEEDPETAARRRLHNSITAGRSSGELKVNMQVLEEVRKLYTLEIGPKLGGDWFEHALVERKFWLRLLEEVAEMGPGEETGRRDPVCRGGI
jgi:hypothetical protein